MSKKEKEKKHTKIITKIVLFSGILIGGEIGIVSMFRVDPDLAGPLMAMVTTMLGAI